MMTLVRDGELEHPDFWMVGILFFGGDIFRFSFNPPKLLEMSKVSTTSLCPYDVA